jgi:hypothetical protein
MKIGRPSGLSNIDQKLIKKLEDTPEMIHLTFNIPLELHTKLKIFAARQRKSMAKVLEEWLANLPD